MKKIGYMGIPGSFSELAADELIRQTNMEDCEAVPMVSAWNILKALQDGEADMGVLGVDNSSVGAVQEFVEAFRDVDYEIIDECVLPIHHCLFKKKNVPQSSLTVVASHPHALSQTAKTRAVEFPQLKDVEIEDTAIGAQWLSEDRLPDNTAVICSINAGRMWDLDMIALNIEDVSTNRTTFWLLKLK